VLQERGIGVDEQLDALAHEELASCVVTLDIARPAARTRVAQLLVVRSHGARFAARLRPNSSLPTSVFDDSTVTTSPLTTPPVPTTC
jgi:hypothetical protein